MYKKTAITDFVSQRTFALVGISRGGKKFGNMIHKELTTRGYQVIPVHPQAESIEGVRCYPSLSALPEPVGGVIVVVPPAQAEKVVQEAHAAGIQRVWLQQGAESPAAIRFCEENNLTVVHGECIMMFAEPVGSIHSFHRWINKLFGKYPK